MRLLLVASCLTLAACAAGEPERHPPGDGPGSGSDDPSDPTIVSVAATCQMMVRVQLRIFATDPAGETNLSTCSGALGSARGDGTFASGLCIVTLQTSCANNQPALVGVTVTNKSGGSTSGSFNVALTPG